VDSFSEALNSLAEMSRSARVRPQHTTDETKHMGTELAKGLQAVAQAPTSGTQPIASRRRPTRVAQTILGHITVYLGPVTAQSALTACCKAMGRAPETIELQDVPELFAAVRPMLGTLLGGSSCRILLRRIERDLHI
jgi:hypothetical protein